MVLCPGTNNDLPANVVNRPQLLQDPACDPLSGSNVVQDLDARPYVFRHPDEQDTTVYQSLAEPPQYKPRGSIPAGNPWCGLWSENFN